MPVTCPCRPGQSSFVVLVRPTRQVTWYYVKEDLELCLLLGLTLAEPVRCRPVNSEFWVPIQATTRETCGGVQSCTAAEYFGFSPSFIQGFIVIHSSTADAVYNICSSLNNTLIETSTSFKFTVYSQFPAYGMESVKLRRCHFINQEAISISSSVQLW